MNWLKTAHKGAIGKIFVGAIKHSTIGEMGFSVKHYLTCSFLNPPYINRTPPESAAIQGSHQKRVMTEHGVKSCI